MFIFLSYLHQKFRNKFVQKKKRHCIRHQQHFVSKCSFLFCSSLFFSVFVILCFELFSLSLSHFHFIYSRYFLVYAAFFPSVIKDLIHWVTKVYVPCLSYWFTYLHVCYYLINNQFENHQVTLFTLYKQIWSNYFNGLFIKSQKPSHKCGHCVLNPTAVLLSSNFTHQLEPNSICW